jgi:hypothetical protein
MSEATSAEARLRVLVLDLDDPHGIAVSQLAPEVLGLALAVVGDDRVRRLQDRVRRAVVLLERDQLRTAEVPLELEDVADVGAAERVDGLVRVTDREHVLVLAGQELEQAVLGVVRVLVLVDEDVAKRLLPARAGLGEALEHLDGQHEQVVEVDGVRGVQAALVEPVHVRDGLVVEGGDARLVLLRPDQLVLRHGDLRVDSAGDEALGITVELLEAELHEPDLVGLVVDREVRAVAEARGFAPEDAPARGVEGHDPHAGSDVAEDALETLLHLAGRLVREGDGQDLLRLHTAGGDEVRDAVGEHPRLSRPRSRDDEDWPFSGQNRLALGGIEIGEIRLGRCDSHGLRS